MTESSQSRCFCMIDRTQGTSFPARVVAEKFAGRQKATENEEDLASSIIGSLRTTEFYCLIFMPKTNAKIPAPIASGN